jgi:hypothetical protein
VCANKSRELAVELGEHVVEWQCVC